MLEYNIKAKKGITYYDLINSADKNLAKKTAICRHNSRNHELNEIIEEEGNVSLIGFDTELGIKIYTRTLQFVFIKAVYDLFDDVKKITLQHSISKSIFGEIVKDKPLSEDDIKLIKDKMKELIDKDIPIHRITVPKEKAVKIFESYGLYDKVRLLKSYDAKEIKLCELDGRYDFFYECMAYSTGAVPVFNLKLYENGFILQRPDKDNLDVIEPFKEQKSLTKVFRQTKKWLDIVGAGEVGTLNEKIEKDGARRIVMISEALHEKEIANIADKISRKDNVKVVLIAGPSSSGKTTFANRLCVQLGVNGVTPIQISLDNYFVNREDTPLDENGNYDYESIDALDLKRLNEDLTALTQGKEIEIPIFNFKTGQREKEGIKTSLPENSVLVLEGIHGLNPKLISEELRKNVFKIYISALTQLNIDNHNRISTTDTRKVRRIVRDSISRGYTAEDTLNMWPSIRRGEKKNIFIFQDEADAVFNSMLVYELCVLKPFALKELEKVPVDSPVYAEARRLKAFLGFFKEIKVDEVPKNSLLREFIGGSCFYEY